jgi:gamma-polyglutamate synthase
MKLILLLFLLLIALGLWELGRHRLNRRRVPVRIHVNGSRGKSSVTRLIAAGLMAGGVRTLTKTTGSAARVIMPDGREAPVRRRGAPNIREQLRIFRRAATEKAEAIVLECMAVRPDLQWICEHRIVGATIGVITNVRPDHLEAMGPRIEDVAQSLAGTVPMNSLLITAEDDFADYLAEVSRIQGTQFIKADPESVTAEELAPFHYVEFAENLSLALAVCEAAGVDRATALAGMYEVKPDIGALVPMFWRETDAEGVERHVEFVNLFAANDPESTAFVWDHLNLPDHKDEAIAVVNIRADRMRRSKDLAPLFGKRIRAARYAVIGEQTDVFGEILRRAGIPRESIVDLGGADAETIWSRLIEISGKRTRIVGLGNIGGVGVALLDLVEGRLATAREEGRA